MAVQSQPTNRFPPAPAPARASAPALAPAPVHSPDLCPALASDFTSASAPAPRYLKKFMTQQRRMIKLTKLRTIFNRIVTIIMEVMNKVDALEAWESTCHECTSKDQVNNYKESIVLEKEELITKKGIKMRKYCETKNENKHKVVHSMKLRNKCC